MRRRAAHALPRPQLLLEVVQLLARQADAVLVPHVLLERTQVLERAAIAARARHRGFIRGRDRTAVHHLEVLLAHLLQLARAPPHLLVRARLGEVEFLHLALLLALLLFLTISLSLAVRLLSLSLSLAVRLGRGGVRVHRRGA